MAEKAGLEKAWEWLGHFGKLKNLFTLAIAFIATVRGLSLMPAGWNPPQQWASAGALFFGTWAVAAAVSRVCESCYRRVVRWKNPAVAVITLNPGRKASLTLKHKGEPTTYSADGKIIAMLNGWPVPQSALFECQLLHKGTATAASVRLNDNDWAHIVLASIEFDHDEGESLHIRRGGIGSTEIVPDAGVELEIKIATNPELSTGAIVRRYRIVRDSHDHIALTENLSL